MIPIGAIVAAAALASRANRPSGQQDRGPNADNQSGWAFLWFVLLPLEIGLFSLLTDGNLIVLPLMILLSIPLFPWFWVRRAFIPLGMFRTAHALTLSAQFLWSGDFRGGQRVAAAWALLRARKVSEADVAWLEQRFIQLSFQPIKGSMLLAHGLHAARTNPEDARRLVASIGWLDPRAVGGRARALASDWLACDAAERGDWHAAARLAKWSSRSSLARFLAAAAHRLLQRDPPMAFTLVVLWLFSRGKRHTWPIMRAACATPRTAPAESRDVFDSLGKGLPPARAAIQRHLATMALAPAELTARRLVALGLAWQEAFRAPAPVVDANAALQAAPEAFPAAVRAQVLDDLTALVKASPVPLAHLVNGGDLLDEALRRACDGWIADLNTSCERLRTRLRAKQALPVMDEWRELIALRLAWEEAVRRGGAAVCRPGFTALHFAANALAVWFFNQCEEKPLANAIHRWLAAEAARAGDSEAVALETKNARIRFL